MPTLTLLLVLLHSLSTLSQPTLPPESLPLLTFKTHADLDNKLTFPSTLPYCQWQGVKCQQSHIIRLSFKSLSLRGTFPPHSLSSLTHLRVLVLRNNSLYGPIPDLSSLPNLRSLLLDHNLFSTTFPYSILSLYTLRVLDLSFNNLSGNLPTDILNLTRLNILRLQFNHFDGVIPPLNQSFLESFNISNNNLTGEIPNTPTLSQFPLSSFEHNFDLCGHVVNKPCGAFLEPSESVLSPPVNVEKTNTHQHAKKIAIVVGVSLGGLLLVSCFICLGLATRRRESGVEGGNDGGDNAEVIRVMRFDNEKWENKNNENNKEIMGGVKRENGKSGNLVFCKGEEKLYTLEQLMKGSAEMLGRGTMGTTYKAKLDNQLILTVKRLDAMKMSGINGEVFEKHMSVVGQLRHPNLVPIRAYFQAKEERLIIYDYQPNGSVFSLIHGK